MNIRFLGHATFLLTTGGKKIVTDPYEPGGFGGAIGYGPMTEAADFVTVSHDHADHNYVKMVPGNPRVISCAGQETHDGILFRPLATYHDASRGAERGRNVVWVIEAEGMVVCHLGDLGHLLSAEEVSALGHVNVLFVPVGGVFTIEATAATAVVEQLRPNIAIPMHYHTPKAGFKLAPVDTFLAGKTAIRSIVGSDFQLTAETLPNPTEIVVLQPAL